MESLYLKRPFLISSLLYPAKPTTQFFARHKVGWVENSIHKQVDILKAYSEDNQARQVMAEAFENLPTTFDSDAFVRMIIEDTETFHRKIGVNTP
jgi:processive 1,2-diacylglycerol beta-glucosyltransferase